MFLGFVSIASSTFAAPLISVRPTARFLHMELDLGASQLTRHKAPYALRQASKLAARDRMQKLAGKPRTEKKGR